MVCCLLDTVTDDDWRGDDVCWDGDDWRGDDGDDGWLGGDCCWGVDGWCGGDCCWGDDVWSDRIKHLTNLKNKYIYLKTSNIKFLRNCLIETLYYFITSIKTRYWLYHISEQSVTYYSKVKLYQSHPPFFEYWIFFIFDPHYILRFLMHIQLEKVFNYYTLLILILLVIFRTINTEWYKFNFLRKSNIIKFYFNYVLTH